MKKIIRSLPALLLGFLCGCLQVKDELTIQPDGSGTVQLEVKSAIPADMAQGLGMEMGGSGNVLYPPTSEAEARKFFAGKDITVTVRQETPDDGGTRTIITAAFKDINVLLAGPYGRAHALSLKIENGVLKCRALSGLEAAARFAEVKDENGGMGMGMAGLGDLQKKKTEMRDEFRITLPGAATASNGKQDGNSVSWIAERAKAANADEFIAEVGRVLEASCSADGLKLAPMTPTRLGLDTFKDLVAGVVAAAAPGPDTNKIAGAAKFVPYALHLTRTLDLSGSGGGGQNSAQLIGAVVMPHELAPQKWGEVKLDEVTDAKGASLKPREQEGRFRSYNRFSNDSPDDDADAKNVNPAEERHPITLEFLPPDWKAKEITRIRGSVALQYFGGLQLVKLSNSIPAGWIMSQEAMMSGGFNSTEKVINDPVLPALGLAIKCAEAMHQNGMTQLGLSLEGSKADVAEVQVFDADGKAWPTMMQNEGGGGSPTLQIMIAGQPKAPFSLALLVSSTGISVDVPINLEHVPVAGK